MKELEPSKGLKPFEGWLETRIKKMKKKPDLLTPEGFSNIGRVRITDDE